MTEDEADAAHARKFTCVCCLHLVFVSFLSLPTHIIHRSDQMAEWAASYLSTHVQFLTVCVDSAGVALQFDRMFGLSNAGVVNGYIPSREYMPRG